MIWDDDLTTSSSTTFRFPHPTEAADPINYEEHLLNLREPIPDSDYQAYKRVIYQLYSEPDRNDDDQVDIGDLITRIEEQATTRSLYLR